MVAQRLEQRTHNSTVAGSIPAHPNSAAYAAFVYKGYTPFLKTLRLSLDTNMVVPYDAFGSVTPPNRRVGMSKADYRREVEHVDAELAMEPFGPDDYADLMMYDDELNSYPDDDFPEDYDIHEDYYQLDWSEFSDPNFDEY